MPSSRCRSLGHAHSLVVLCFGVCEDVRLEVRRLGKLLVAAVEGTDVWPVSSVNAHVCAQVKVQGEPLSTALKRALRMREEECYRVEG